MERKKEKRIKDLYFLKVNDVIFPVFCRSDELQDIIDFLWDEIQERERAEEGGLCGTGLAQQRFKF